MVDVEMLMRRTEQLAREAGIALHPNYARCYAKYDETTDSVVWVICEPGPVGVKTASRVVDHEQAAEVFQRIAQGLCY
ncbi:hypothetical protein B0G71_4357 [Paraburkholderia sp. BL27I4N3]|uniref:hypothetical protein n=1 Tax=Paraburkholderia sp. BL27I4N3 TaxID=1938805 RepID=UPI000E37C622|nr:hypothetical protein [Paraburkholderia sp. BL27I4N3]REE21205.1 hypothetical protein B0G71_4357 [Paraburkholderia sp. BL27I4N3]